jgi:16S rRNA (guanine527-N7)-methyltransferase
MFHVKHAVALSARRSFLESDPGLIAPGLISCTLKGQSDKGHCGWRSLSRQRVMLPVATAYSTMRLMLARNTVRELLAPFDVSLSDETVDGLLAYLDLLLRWNQKINLTSIGTPEECITRHFGESFLVSRIVPLQGRLLDIGSGAGFPGLAVKLIAPDLEVVLLEPVAKRRAFLKEAARACNMGSVKVVGSRLDEFSKTGQAELFNVITVRAVGGLDSLIPLAGGLLKSGGHLCLWVGAQQGKEICDGNPNLQWLPPVTVPVSHERQILAGMRHI